jgi:hypothetical protein
MNKPQIQLLMATKIIVHFMLCGPVSHFNTLSYQFKFVFSMRYCSNNLNMLINQSPLVFLLKISVTDIDMVVSDVSSIASSYGSVLTLSGVLGLVLFARET